MTGVMAALAGAGPGFTINIENTLASSNVVDPADASANFTLNSNGTTVATGAAPPNWISPVSGAGLFEARMTLTSGAFTSGPASGTWNQLNVNRTWNVTRTLIGLDQAIATLDIREISSGVIRDTATITISADVS